MSSPSPIPRVDLDGSPKALDDLRDSEVHENEEEQVMAALVVKDLYFGSDKMGGVLRRDIRRAF